jgi:AraC-like DNA-binding protein
MLPMLLLPLVAPLFLVYVSLIIRDGDRLSWKWSLHFIPAIIYAVYKFPFFMQDGNAKISYIERWFDNSIDIGARIENFTVMFVVAFQIVVYFSIILRNLSTFKKKLNEVFSSDKIDLDWIRRFIFLTVFIFGAVGCALAAMTFFDVPLKTVYRFLPPVVVLSICYLAFHAAHQSDVTVGIKLSELQEMTLPVPSLKQHEIDGIAERLRSLMEIEKPYLEPNLTLPELAQKLGILRNQLSYVINNRFGTSFYDFINRYRVEEAKRIISDQNKASFNMLNIGMNVGFSSKTAFNVNFKKFTSMPPSIYKLRISDRQMDS